MKESEIITGNLGREFVVAGADQPSFRIDLDDVGYQIARVDRAEEKRQRPSARPHANWSTHALGDALVDALASGQLYTPALQ